MAKPAARSAAGQGQYVTLGIEDEVFAVPVESVLEILDMRRVCRIPEAPSYMLGLLDLRGRSVPVLDLRVKLGLPPKSATDTTRILVVEVIMNGRPLVLGLVAGYVGSTIVNKSGSGRIVDVALGAVGAVVCGYIGTLVGIGVVFGLNLSTLFSLLVAIIGAVVVLTVYRSVAGRS